MAGQAQISFVQLDDCITHPNLIDDMFKPDITIVQVCMLHKMGLRMEAFKAKNTDDRFWGGVISMILH